MQACENCGEPATRRVIEGWDPRTRQTTDVDVDYGYYCTDCAGETGEEWEDDEDPGDEPNYGCSLDEQIQHARDMERWDRHPSW